MAAYNGERFIGQQLESVARQTLLPRELVITDDGSSDGTREIVTEFARRAPFPVRLYRNEKRLWYADNFLRAASLCRGDLIAFCDHDDVWLEGKLARCAKALEDDSVLLVVHSGEMVDENLKPLGWQLPRIDRDAVTSPLIMGPGRDLSGFAMVFRATLPLLFTGNRPWSSADRRGPMVHDQWVFFLANVLGTVAYLREPLALHRRHHETSTTPVQLLTGDAVRKSSVAGGDSYLKVAELNDDYASFWDQAAASLEDEQLWSRAIEGARHYRRIALIFRTRSVIYQETKPFLLRLLTLTGLVLQRGYGRPSQGRLGARSLLKDVTAGLFSIGRRQQ